MKQNGKKKTKTKAKSRFQKILLRKKRLDFGFSQQAVSNQLILDGHALKSTMLDGT